jgi:hypothetical protein
MLRGEDGDGWQAGRAVIVTDYLHDNNQEH